MLLAAFLTSAMSIAATGAWYLLLGRHRDEGRVMLHWSLGLVAVLIPIQLFFGHPDRSIRSQAPAREICCDRSPLEEPTTGQRGPDRDSRSGQRA